MGLKVIRAAVQQGQTIFAFDVSGFEYLVKNFSDSDIYVALEEGATEADSILIPSGCAQVLRVNKGSVSYKEHGKVQIIADTASDKGVEIQCIRW